MLARLTVMTALLLLAAPTFSQDAEKLAISGKLAYRAFECSHLASSQQDEAQQTRLFALGLGEALKVAEGFKAGRVTTEQLSEEEVLVTFFMEGPSADFIAGRIYEGAGDNVWLQIKSAAGNDGSFAKERQVATRLYKDKNCELIGGGR